MTEPNPKLRVVQEDGKFIIRDEEGGTYGTFDKQAQAEDIMADWNAYYEAPLIS